MVRKHLLRRINQNRLRDGLGKAALAERKSDFACEITPLPPWARPMLGGRGEQVNVPESDLETVKAMASRTASSTEVDPTTGADLGAGQVGMTK